MASVIKFKSGGHKFVSYEEALLIWSWISADPQTVDSRYKQYADSIADVFIERRKRHLAPPEYLESHPLPINPEEGTLEDWRRPSYARTLGVRN